MRIIVVLVLAGLAATSNTQLFGLLLTSIADELDRSISLVGSFRIFTSLSAMIGALVLTRVADRFIRKRLMMFGFVLLIASSLVAATATTLPQFFIYFVLGGFADVLLFSTILVAASDYFEGHDLERANGFVIGSFALPGFVVVPLAGVISDEVSWRAAYLLLTGLAVMAILVVLFLLPEVEPSRDGESMTFRTQIRVLAGHAGLGWIVLGNVARFAMLTILMLYTASFVIDRYGLSDAGAGLFVGAVSLVGMFIAFSSGFIIERLGLWRVLIPGGVVLASTFFLGFTPQWALAISGCFLILSAGVLWMQENAALGTLIRLAGRDRGAATAVNEFGAGIGTLSGTGLGALVIAFVGFSGLGILSAVIGIAGVIVTNVALRSLKRTRQIATSEAAS